MPLSPNTLKQWMMLVQEMDLAEPRAAELAVEVERLNNAVRKASKLLDFDIEPSSFVTILAAHAQRKAKDGS
jgi:hypothetical protein